MTHGAGPSIPPSVTLTVLIPTRNEAANIQELIAQLSSELGEIDAELLIVDDSSDETPNLASSMAVAHPVRVIHRVAAERTDGLGGAVRLGLLEARGSFVCVMDADFQHPPSTVPLLLAHAQAHQGVDVVVASRYVPGGSATGLSGPIRYAVSRLSVLLARQLLRPALNGVSDVASGFFLVRRERLDPHRLHPHGFKILLDVLVRNPQLRAEEVPFRFQPRAGGLSKASAMEGLRFLRVLTVLWLTVPGAGRFWKFLLVGISGLAVNVTVFLGVSKVASSHWTPFFFGVEASIISNFVLNSLFTFADSTWRSLRQIVTGVTKYHLSVFVAIVVNMCVFGAGMRVLPGLAVLWVVVGATLGAAVNFVLVSRFVFPVIGASRSGGFFPWGRRAGAHEPIVGEESEQLSG